MKSPATIGQARRWAWRAGTVVALVILVSALLAGPYRFLFGNIAGSAAEPARLAPCLPGEPVAILDSPHISEAAAEFVDYNSQPPTSGPHYPFVAATGVYDQPIDDGLTVHALEHGHVAVQYATDLPDDQVRDLVRLVKSYGSGVILAPYPALEDGIALTAWGRIELIDAFHEERIGEFVDALQGRYDHGWATPEDCPGNSEVADR